MSARRSILESCNLFASIFYRPIELNSSGRFPVTIILVAAVADGHRRELPHAPVDVVEVTQQCADVLNRCFHHVTVKHCVIFLFMTFAIGHGELLRALLRLFIAQKQLFAILGKLLLSDLLTLREDGLDASLRDNEGSSVLQGLHRRCLGDEQRAIGVLLNKKTFLACEIHFSHIHSAYP